MKKVGFYGGTFDPIHFGHLYLALQLAEIHGLDLVLVCPAFCSPFKTGEEPLVAPHHRLEMVKLALEGVPRFEAISTEIDRKEISYTIDTIRSLPSSNQYHLLLSEESAAQFHKWKESEELIRLAPPLIGCRKAAAPSSLPASLKNGFTPTKIMDLSSTDIRDRLKKNLYCGHLIPAKALDYIHRHRLYSGSN